MDGGYEERRAGGFWAHPEPIVGAICGTVRGAV